LDRATKKQISRGVGQSMIVRRIAVDTSVILDDIAFVNLQMSAHARLVDGAMQLGGAPKLPNFAVPLKRGVHLLTTPSIPQLVVTCRAGAQGPSVFSFSFYAADVDRECSLALSPFSWVT